MSMVSIDKPTRSCLIRRIKRHVQTIALITNENRQGNLLVLPVWDSASPSPRHGLQAETRSIFLSIPSAGQRNGGAIRFSRNPERAHNHGARNAKTERTHFFKDGVECLTVMIMLASFDSLKIDVFFLLVITGCFVAFWGLSVRARRQGNLDRPTKQWWFFVAALIGSSLFLACRVRWWLGFVPLLPLVLFSLLLRPCAKGVLLGEQKRDPK